MPPALNDKVNTMSKISERIEAAQTALTAKKDHLTALVKSMEENPTDDALIAQVDSVSAEIESETKSIEALKKAEIALAASVAPAIVKSTSKDVADPAGLLVKTALCTFEAYTKRVPFEMVMQERYGNDRGFEQIKAVGEVINKAATPQNPAVTSVPGWAQELVRDSYGAFMDLLAAESVVPRIPMERYSFDGFGAITIANRANKTKNLGAAFRAEGAPIRVGSTTLGSKKLTPKSMGIIGTFSNELFARSTPNIEALIRNWMIEDTAEVLDQTFLDAVAGTAIRPAGIANGLAAGDTAAATAGATQAGITADVRARFAALAAAKLGRRLVWIMNTQHFVGLKLSLTATGTLAFPEAQSGMLVGYPVITSTNVPVGDVFLVDAAELAFAGGAPTFMGTEVATIHEEYSAADVKPIVGGTAAAPAPAAPVRSLFQTNSSALRALWEIDWSVQRVGAVQLITGAAW